MKDAEPDEKVESSAPEWFVAVDAARVDAEADARFAAWLAADPEHEHALARCEAALALTKRLGDTAKLGLAFDEAARIAAGDLRAPSGRSRPTHAIVAWSAAAASLLAALTLWVQREPPSSAPEPPPAATLAGAPSERPSSARVDVASAESAVALPGPIIVDARSVAVLPFAEAAAPPAGADEERALAAALHEEVVRQLASIPGVYVVDRQAVAPYVGSDIDAEQIAAQLGVRGIVEAQVGVVGGRVQVTLRMTDAARAGPPTQDAFERPVDELGAIRAEIVTNIAQALAATPVPPAYVPSLQ